MGQIIPFILESITWVPTENAKLFIHISFYMNSLFFYMNLYEAYIFI